VCRKPGINVGISWFLETKDGRTFISHGGGDDGFVTSIVLLPEMNVAFVLMQNSEHPGLTVGKAAQHAALYYFVNKKK
jgi:hypothetical protein